MMHENIRYICTESALVAGREASLAMASSMPFSKDDGGQLMTGGVLAAQGKVTDFFAQFIAASVHFIGCPETVENDAFWVSPVTDQPAYFSGMAGWASVAGHQNFSHQRSYGVVYIPTGGIYYAGGNYEGAGAGIYDVDTSDGLSIRASTELNVDSVLACSGNANKYGGIADVFLGQTFVPGWAAAISVAVGKVSAALIVGCNWPDIFGAIAVCQGSGCSYSATRNQDGTYDVLIANDEYNLSEAARAGGFPA